VDAALDAADAFNALDAIVDASLDIPVDSIVVDATPTPIVRESAGIWPWTMESIGIATGVVGWRFRVEPPGIEVERVGFYGNPRCCGTRLLAAIVELSGQLDYPDTTDLSSGDVIATTTLDPAPTPSTMRNIDIEFPLSVRLDPGWHAVVFRTEVPGTQSANLACVHGPSTPGEQILFAGSSGVWVRMANACGSFGGVLRVFVYGLTTPP
jgi:hypothetical protein